MLENVCGVYTELIHLDNFELLVRACVRAYHFQRKLFPPLSVALSLLFCILYANDTLFKALSLSLTHSFIFLFHQFSSFVRLLKSFIYITMGATVSFDPISYNTFNKTGVFMRKTIHARTHTILWKHTLCTDKNRSSLN